MKKNLILFLMFFLCLSFINIVRAEYLDYTGVSYDISSEDDVPSGMYFNGTNWFMIGQRNDSVFVYDENWNYLNISYDISGQDSIPADIFFNETNWFMLGFNSNNVYVYDENWNYLNISYDISNEDIWSEGIFFNGTNWYLLGRNTGSIYVYDENWNYLNISYDISQEENIPIDIYFNGTNWFMAGYNHSTIFIYDNNWNYLNISYNISGQDSSPNDIFFNGTNWFILGGLYNKVFVYELKSYFIEFDLLEEFKGYGINEFDLNFSYYYPDHAVKFMTLRNEEMVWLNELAWGSEYQYHGGFSELDYGRYYVRLDICNADETICYFDNKQVNLNGVWYANNTEQDNANVTQNWIYIDWDYFTEYVTPNDISIELDKGEEHFEEHLGNVDVYSYNWTNLSYGTYSYTIYINHQGNWLSTQTRQITLIEPEVPLITGDVVADFNAEGKIMVLITILLIGSLVVFLTTKFKKKGMKKLSVYSIFFLVFTTKVFATEIDYTLENTLFSIVTIFLILSIIYVVYSKFFKSK